jgi:cytochrome-b5 reductase
LQIKANNPGPDASVKMLMCGPPPMVNALKGHLEKIGYDRKSQTFAF